MEKQRRRGRPLTFSWEERAYLAELVRAHGVRGARRNSEIPVCQQTLSKIAAEFSIILKKGKRPRKAA